MDGSCIFVGYPVIDIFLDRARLADIPACTGKTSDHRVGTVHIAGEFRWFHCLDTLPDDKL